MVKRTIKPRKSASRRLTRTNRKQGMGFLGKAAIAGIIGLGLGGISVGEFETNALQGCAASYYAAGKKAEDLPSYAQVSGASSRKKKADEKDTASITPQGVYQQIKDFKPTERPFKRVEASPVFYQAPTLQQPLKTGVITVYDTKENVLDYIGTNALTYQEINDRFPILLNALVAAEDSGTVIPILGRVSSFRDHYGINPLAILRAGISKAKGGSARGVSTLEQTLYGDETEKRSLGKNTAGKFEEMKNTLAVAKRLEQQYGTLLAKARSGDADAKTTLEKVLTKGEIENTHYPSAHELYKRHILVTAANYIDVGRYNSMIGIFDAKQRGDFAEHKTDLSNPEDLLQAAVLEAYTVISIRTPTNYVTRVANSYASTAKNNGRSKKTEQSTFTYRSKEYTGQSFLKEEGVQRVASLLRKMKELGTLPSALQTLVSGEDLNDKVYTILDEAFAPSKNTKERQIAGLPQWYKEAVIAQLEKVAGVPLDQIEGITLGVVVPYNPTIDRKVTTALTTVAAKDPNHDIYSVLVLDPETGAVISRHGAQYYGKSGNGGRAVFFDVTRQGGLQAASLIKPVTYARVLDTETTPACMGLNLAEIPRREEMIRWREAELPRTFEEISRSSSWNDGEALKNYEDKTSPVSVTPGAGPAQGVSYTPMINGLVGSINTTTVSFAQRAKGGNDQASQQAVDTWYTGVFGEAMEGNNRAWQDAPWALGVDPLKLDEVARALSFTMEEGRAPVHVHDMLAIIGPDGKPLYQADLSHLEVASKAAAAQVHTMLTGVFSSEVKAPDGTVVISQGTGKSYEDTYRNAVSIRVGKTGTAPNTEYGFTFMGITAGEERYVVLVARQQGNPNKPHKITGASAMELADRIYEGLVPEPNPKEVVAAYTTRVNRIFDQYFVPAQKPIEQKLTEAQVDDIFAGNENAAQAPAAPVLKSYDFGGTSYTLKPDLTSTDLETALIQLQYANDATTRLTKANAKGVDTLAEKARFCRDTLADVLSQYHKALAATESALVAPAYDSPFGPASGGPLTVTVNGTSVPYVYCPSPAYATVDPIIGYQPGAAQTSGSIVQPQADPSGVQPLPSSDTTGAGAPPQPGTAPNGAPIQAPPVQPTPDLIDSLFK